MKSNKDVEFAKQPAVGRCRAVKPYLSQSKTVLKSYITPAQHMMLHLGPV